MDCSDGSADLHGMDLLLKGKIQTDWVLVDEAYRELFDELMLLLRHRESILVYIMHQRPKRRAGREGTDDCVDAAGAQGVQ